MVRVLWEEEQEVRDVVKHIIKLKVTCTLKSALHSCRLSTQCQSGPGSPQALTKKENTSRDGGSTALYTVYTVYTVQTAVIKAKNLQFAENIKEKDHC